MTIESLTEPELTLVRALRDIPRGIAREELMPLIEDLVSFVRDPKCAQAQGDGVPCVSVGNACEACQSVADTLARLHRRLYQR
jgi:hypothetical protein